MLINACGAPRRDITIAYECVVAPQKRWGKNGQIPDTTKQLPKDETGQHKKKNLQKQRAKFIRLHLLCQQLLPRRPTMIKMKRKMIRVRRQNLLMQMGSFPRQPTVAFPSMYIAETKFQGWSEKDAGGAACSLSIGIKPATPFDDYIDGALTFSLF